MNRLLVFSTPKPGQVDEYHAYYDERHVPDILALPGVVAARRVDAALAGSRPDVPTFATEIEVEGDPRDVLKLLVAGMSSGAIASSDTVDSAQTRAWILRERAGAACQT